MAEERDFFAEDFGGSSQAVQEQDSFARDFGGQQQESGSRFFSDTPIESGVSRTNFLQDLTLSFTDNPETKMQFLQEQFPTSNVEVDPKQGLLIDGARVNPEGFDFGDITRSAGGVLPFAGQIAGSILGIPAGPGGIIGGGIGGATLGKGVQLAAGQILGLDQDGKDVLESLATEAAFAGIGEVTGLGIGGGLAKLGKTKAINGIANFWNKTFNKLGTKTAPIVAQFVGNVKKSATNVTMEQGPSRVLSPKFFDPDATPKIIKKTLFGNEKASLVDQFLRTGSSISKGTESIIKNIKTLGSSSYDDLIKAISGNKIDDVTLNSIREFPEKELFNPANVRPDRPFQLSNQVIKGVEDNIDRLGTNLRKATNKVLETKGTGKFQLNEITSQLESLRKELNITQGIKVPGFKPFGRIDVKGAKNLGKIVNLFKAELNEGLKTSLKKSGTLLGKRGVEEAFEKKFFVSSVNNRQAAKLLRKFNLLTEEVFLDKKIDGEIKNVVRKVADTFRTNYYKQLGIEGEASSFRVFQETLDGLRINNNAARREMENTIKGFSRRTFTEQNRLVGILENIPVGKAGKPDGKTMLKNIRLQNAGADLEKIVPSELAGKLEGELTKDAILDVNKNNLKGSLLKEIDDGLKLNPKSAKFAFFDDAQASLAAKEFTKGSANILRVSTIASMAGLGGLGAELGGPVGAGAGLIAGLALTNPRNIARALVAMDKLAIKSAGKKATKTLNPKAQEKFRKGSQAVLRRLLTQQGLQLRE